MSCADICLTMDFDGTNEFFNKKMVKANKSHTCCECGSIIFSGDHYERASGKSDGEVWTAKTCLPCAEIRQEFVCGSWVYGELWESIREEMFPVWKKTGSWDCLAKLTSEQAITKCNQEYKEWRENWYEY